MKYYVTTDGNIQAIGKCADDYFIRDIEKHVIEEYNVTKCYYINNDSATADEILEGWKESDPEGMTTRWVGYYEELLLYISSADMQKLGWNKERALEEFENIIGGVIGNDLDIYTVDIYDGKTLELLDMSGEVIEADEQNLVEEGAEYLGEFDSLEDAKEELDRQVTETVLEKIEDATGWEITIEQDNWRHGIDVTATHWFGPWDEYAEAWSGCYDSLDDFLEHFADDIMGYYDDFSVDEFVSMWLGGKGAPNARTLVETAEDIESGYEDLSIEFSRLVGNRNAGEFYLDKICA